MEQDGGGGGGPSQPCILASPNNTSDEVWCGVVVWAVRKDGLG
jgi:hypothetical protein